MIERYMNGELARIWSLDRTYARWHEVEITHMREIAGADAAELLRDSGPPRESEVRRKEKVTGHDVAAFLAVLDDRIGRHARTRHGYDEGVMELAAKVRSSLHFGLTSSDVVDTALALALANSRAVVDREVDTLIATLVAFYRGLSGKQTIGRTHGQLASTMPAGWRWEVLERMLERVWFRADSAFGYVDIGKLSGPVGVDDVGDQEAALERLGLRESESTQIVPRDRLAHLAHCLAELATVCEAIVTQVWLLAQQGIEELRVEPAGAVGSSAMPHKVNPILAENVRGLARMARANAETLQLGMVQWGEHDLAHSSVERVALPDLLHLVVAALSRTAALVAGLSWGDPEIPSGYRDSSAVLRGLQANGAPYVEAHRQLTDLYRDGKITTTTTEGDR